MKTILSFLILGVFFIGCKDPVSTYEQPPQPPQGLSALALSNRVDLSWYPSQIQHTVEYKVWVSDAYNGKYVLIGRTADNFFTDGDALNGSLYYYAVSSVNDAGVESALTSDNVHAIPRPEGSGVVIDDYHVSPSTAGYHFKSNSVGLYNDAYTDVFFENASGRYYLDVFSDTRIQDMGYTADLDVIAASPATGWSPSGTVEAIPGHTYVVRTKDLNYAKMRVTLVSASSVTFEWAYQTVQGVTLLKPGRTPYAPAVTASGVQRLPAVH
jgi:hypothetical protein